MRTIVLMDFDGVIADSEQIAHDLAMRMCALMTHERHLKAFEGNINRSYEDLIPGPHPAECRHDLNWWQEYEPLFPTVGIFAGMKDAVRRLADEHMLVIVSSTITRPIDQFLNKHGMREHFEQILGNDVHFSKVEKIRMVLDTRTTVPEKCVFITDTLGDMREAEEHGINVIGVSWGFHPRSTLERGVPFRIVEAPSELPDAVSDYFSR